MDYSDVLERIEKALDAATDALKEFTPGKIQSSLKDGGDPVTEADVLLDRILKKELLRDDEGWLSEETVDDLSRLEKERVWIVDPLDGTREFIEGLPEWCISIAYVINGTSWFAIHPNGSHSTRSGNIKKHSRLFIVVGKYFIEHFAWMLTRLEKTVLQSQNIFPRQ